MSRRILLVDDNELNRQLLKDLLELDGYEDVVEAASVADAMARLDEGPYGLALLDIQLPDGSGEDVLRALRDRDGAGATPALAVTAYAAQEDEQRLRELGFDGYISKPMDTKAFRATVRRILGGEEA